MKKTTLFTIPVFFIPLVFLTACSPYKEITHKDFVSGGRKVLVCPVHVMTYYGNHQDSGYSEQIVSYINANKYADASLTALCPPPNEEFYHNEAKILKKSKELFIEFVKGINMPGDTYMLYPEFFMMGDSPEAMAVHFVLLNNKGEVAMLGLINSHWEEYQKVSPKSLNDLVAVFKNGFENGMKK